MKKGKIFLNQKNEAKIEIQKRTIRNYTHTVNIDSKIVSITTWRKSKLKFRLNLITNILTLGILHIISLFNPKLYLKIYCKESLPSNSDFFLVEDIYQNFTLCKTIYTKCSKRKISYSSNPSNNEKRINVSISFIYNSIKYKYDNDLNSVIPVFFNLSLYKNSTIVGAFSEGINSREKYERQIEKYGKNIMNLNNKLIYENFFKSDLPQCASVFLSGGICGICGLYLFGVILMTLSVIVILIKIIYRYLKFVKKLGNDYSLDGITEYKVKRKYLKEKKINGYNLVKNIDLVPGDILSLNEGDIIPCDCIILDGECILNDCKIIGKIDNSIRYALEGNNNFFDYEKNKNSIAFHGSEILKIYSKDNYKNVIVLAINTGINSFKGNLFSNLLYRKTIYHKYSNILDIILEKYYLIFILILYLSSSIGIISRYFLTGKKYSISNHLVLNLGLILMPIYYIIICSIKHLGIYFLNKDNNRDIQCIDESRLIESGKINRVILDKTGTLTENNIKISAFIPLYYDNSGSKFFFKIFDKNNIKKICDEHLVYYRNYLLKKNFKDKAELNMQDEYKNILIDSFYDKGLCDENTSYELSALFLQCLICCSNLAKINNEICGNIIDKEIIELMKWDINTVELMSENNEDANYYKKTENIINKIHRIGSIFFDDTNNINNNYNYNSLNIINEVFPKNYFKITEGMKIKKTKEQIKSIINDNNQNKLNSFKLIIMNRFFSNSYMSISSIVYNFIEDNYRFMIKGPPEKILRYCINSSIPDIERILSKTLKEGYRVIACATKVIEYSHKDKNQKEEYYLSDLIFCGFILIKNNLKEESKQIIKNIKKMECDIAISTGDSLFNSIGMGIQCKLINEKNTYALDLNVNGRKSKIIVLGIGNNLKEEEEFENETYTIQNSSNQKSDNKKLAEEKKSEKSKLNNILKSKSFARLNIPVNNNNNTLITDIPSSRGMLQNNETIIQNNELNKNYENETSSLEKIDTSHFDEINNSPISYYLNEEQNASSINKLKNSFKLSGSTLINDFESGQNYNLNSLSNEKSNKKFNTQIKNINLIHGKSSIKLNEFRLDSGVPFQTSSKKPVIKKRTTNIKNIRGFDILKEKTFKVPSSKNINNSKGINKKYNNKEISFNLEYQKSKNNFFSNRDYFEYSMEKKKIFERGCTLCFSGKVLKYIYDNRKRKDIKELLKLMNRFGKIFFSMSSYEKSLLIELNKVVFNKKVCMVGDGINDIDSIMTSNVGIYIGQQKNLNTLLSHFYIKENNLMSIETIIKNGRGYYENDSLLLPTNFIFTACWVGLITYSYFLEKKVDNSMLTLLNISIFILCISAFTIQPDYKIHFNYLVSNEKLLRNFRCIIFLGIFIIKIICQIVFYFTYDYNNNIDQEENKEIILSYIFIMTWSQSMSTVLTYNICTFYRKSILSNFTFLVIYLGIFAYLIHLLTINDLAIGQVSIIKIKFEFSNKNVDFFDDSHKLILIIIILSDIIFPCILVIILKIIYEKKASNLRYKIEGKEKSE